MSDRFPTFAHRRCWLRTTAFAYNGPLARQIMAASGLIQPHRAQVRNLHSDSSHVTNRCHKSRAPRPSPFHWSISRRPRIPGLRYPPSSSISAAESAGARHGGPPRVRGPLYTHGGAGAPPRGKWARAPRAGATRAAPSIRRTGEPAASGGRASTRAPVRGRASMSKKFANIAAGRRQKSSLTDSEERLIAGVMRNVHATASLVTPPPSGSRALRTSSARPPPCPRPLARPLTSARGRPRAHAAGARGLLCCNPGHRLALLAQSTRSLPCCAVRFTLLPRSA